MGPTLLLVFVATAQLHPKLDPPAREALASAGPSEPVTLSAWLRDDALGFDARAALDARLGRRAGAAEVEAAIADVTREFAARMTAGVTGPFAAAARAAGFEVVVQGQLMPVVAFRGPRAALAGWLEARAEAASVHLDRPGAEELAASVPTLRADRVRAEPGGPTGAGVRVGIVDTGTVSTENPWLPPGTVTEGAPVPQTHATAVAGIVASRHPTMAGVAPGASLLSATYGGTEATMIAAAEWAYGQGAHVVNISLQVPADTTGVVNLGDRGFDYVIRNLGRLMVKSCGNQGAGNAVTSPGRGWNSIAVGNFDDRNDSDWSGDAMNASSSTRDPASGAPKPEVAAPGTSLEATIAVAPWTGAIGTGTSYAAPHVAGLLALLMEEDPLLRTKPEALKAIVLASAWHNVEGDATLSDADGAGGVDAAAAWRVVRAGRVAHGTLTAADFDAAGNRDFAFELQAGNRTRVAASWNSNPSGPPTYAADVLQARFDLTVLAPGGGGPVAAAGHPAAAWRIAEFTAPVSGTYTVRLTRLQFDGASEPFGLAVSQRQDGDTGRIEGVADQRVGTMHAMTVVDPYHPGAAYVVGVGLSGGSYDAGVRLTERVLPLVVDALTITALVAPGGSFTGLAGSLGPTGRAGFTVALPPRPGLAGLELSWCAVTLGPGAPDRVKSVSPRYVSRTLP
jgi:hypothetical protein